MCKLFRAATQRAKSAVFVLWRGFTAPQNKNGTLCEALEALRGQHNLHIALFNLFLSEKTVLSLEKASTAPFRSRVTLDILCLR
jgi:hypothetical protein